MEDTLLIEIKDYLKTAQISPSYFGKLVSNNSDIVKRLERGGTVTMRTAEKIRAFIAARTAEAA